MFAMKTLQPARRPNSTARATGLAQLSFERPELEGAGSFVPLSGLAPASQHDARVADVERIVRGSPGLVGSAP